MLPPRVAFPAVLLSILLGGWPFSASLHGSALAAEAAVQGSGMGGEKTVAIAQTARRLLINVPGIVTVRIVADARPQVLVRTDRNLLPHIAVTSLASSVRIEASRSFRTARGVEIDVVLNALESLDTIGAADVTVSQLNEPKLALNVAGAGSVRLASGKVKELQLNLDGSGDVQATSVSAASCKVASSGAGSVALHCNDSISGELAGAGELIVAGSPKRRAVRATGAAEVQFVR